MKQFHLFQVQTLADSTEKDLLLLQIQFQRILEQCQAVTQYIIQKEMLIILTKCGGISYVQILV